MVHEIPAATLIMIGKGPLIDLVKAQVATAGVTLIVDPPRSTIFSKLARSQVLVLPSQPSPTWREQIGLPILEGLSYGCTIVTTSQTGIAEWLTKHGHEVVDPPGSIEDLASAIVRALTHPLAVREVLASLPAVDSRLSADAWMFSQT